MSEIILRPYQQKFIDDVREEFRRTKRVVGVAPCGAGKTIMTGWMIRQSLKNGKRSIFFVHRKELIEQTARTFYELEIPFGIIAAGQKLQLEKPVQIAAVQTLARRLDKIPEPDFLICDECHHILANTYKKILDAFPSAFLLGVTATPQRMGGINLGNVFGALVESLSVDELIERGNLTSFKYFAPAIGVDLSKVRKKFGEFVNSDLENVMGKTRIIGGIVENYRKLADGKQAICYCVNVRHSKSVANAFNDAGIPAAHVDGDTESSLRAKIVESFRQGKTKVLCNAELFGEGFDVPKCQAVILARPTNSLTLYIQQSMRAMRPDPDDKDKVALIIDHVQNYLRHGLPNADHNWSLSKSVEIKAEKLRHCPECDAVVPEHKKICPYCGYVWPLYEREEKYIEETEDTLVEINPSRENSVIQPNSIEHFLTAARFQGKSKWWAACKAAECAKTYDDCRHIVEVCGYKTGCAWYLWQEQLQKNKLQNARLVC